MFGAIFAVPHLVMAINASEFSQHMPNEKMSREKLHIFTQQCIIELRCNWLLTTFRCNLVNEIISKKLKYGVFKTFWSFRGGVYGRRTSSIGICLQKFSTNQRFQKQMFCVAELENDSRRSIYLQNIFMLFRKTLTITFEETHFLERGCLEEGGLCKIFLFLWWTFIRRWRE